MIQVVNWPTWSGAGGVYVGRPGVLGNPYVIGRDGNRDDVIEQYVGWLRAEWKKAGAVKQELLQLARRYHARGALVLVCSCQPKRCHGDVLARAIEKICAQEGA